MWRTVLPWAVLWAFLAALVLAGFHHLVSRNRDE